jgi:hypothetical protein
MISRRHFVCGLGAALVPLPAAAQAPWGVVRDLIGEVTLNGYRVTRDTALQPGQTLATGADGQIRFTVGNDAFFLRPNSRLRLDGSRPSEPFIDFLRLVTGALGATFERGRPRSIVTPTSTIGIRGTGVYLEAAADWTYACTCFGTTELSSSANERLAVSAERHEARLVRSGVPIARAAMERHTSEEIAALEALVGRPNPFRS